ncbi:MAG: DHH family phosphoesterase [Planctomycetes bacterium]|nr:DHH family phosphoesterase [Planctomycetota bacterium]
MDDRTGALLEVLSERRSLLVLTHANPDPDSLASAMGLRHLAERRFGMKTEFGFAGRIMRAENREMVRRCGIGMTPQEKVEPDAWDCLAVVDTQPGFGHTHLPTGRAIDIVVDHHVPPTGPGSEVRAAFHDVRTDVGATSSMVGGYLLDTGVDIPRPLATALLYGIRTDTGDMSRNVSDLDRRVHEHVQRLADFAVLHKIHKPALPADYFRTLRVALNNVRIYDDLILCSLGRVSSPEMVAEVADLLLRCEGKQTVFCGGLCGSVYYVSLRTELSRDAYDLLRQALDGDGSFGGHGALAGGFIALPDDDERTLRRFERKLERNILAAVGRSDITVGGLGGVQE